MPQQGQCRVRVTRRNKKIAFGRQPRAQTDIGQPDRTMGGQQAPGGPNVSRTCKDGRVEQDEKLGSHRLWPLLAISFRLLAMASGGGKLVDLVGDDGHRKVSVGEPGDRTRPEPVTAGADRPAPAGVHRFTGPCPGMAQPSAPGMEQRKATQAGQLHVVHAGLTGQAQRRSQGLGRAVQTTPPQLGTPPGGKSDGPHCGQAPPLARITALGRLVRTLTGTQQPAGVVEHPVGVRLKLGAPHLQAVQGGRHQTPAIRRQVGHPGPRAFQAAGRGLGVTGPDAASRRNERTLGRLASRSAGEGVHERTHLIGVRARATRPCDHTETALDEQAGGITPVSGAAGVPHGGGQVPVVGEPHGGAQVQFGFVLPGLSYEIGVQGLGKEPVEAVPGVVTVDTDHERVGPGQVRQQHPPVHDRGVPPARGGSGDRGERRGRPAGFGGDDVEQWPGQPVEHARAQQQAADRPRLAPEDLRTEILGDFAAGAVGIPGVPTGQRRAVPIGEGRARGPQPQARSPAFGPLQQLVTTGVGQIDAMGLQQRGRLLGSEGEVDGADLDQPAVEAQPVQREDRITRAEHEPQRRPGTSCQQLEPGDHDRIRDQMHIVNDQYDWCGQLGEGVGQLPPEPSGPAIADERQRTADRSAADRSGAGRSAGKQTADSRSGMSCAGSRRDGTTALQRAQQVEPQLGGCLAVHRQPCDRSRPAGGGSPGRGKDGLAGPRRPIDHRDSTTNTSVDGLPEADSRDVDGGQRWRVRSRDNEGHSCAGFIRVKSNGRGRLTVNHVTTPHRPGAQRSGIATSGYGQDETDDQTTTNPRERDQSRPGCDVPDGVVPLKV